MFEKKPNFRTGGDVMTCPVQPSETQVRFSAKITVSILRKPRVTKPRASTIHAHISLLSAYGQVHDKRCGQLQAYYILATNLVKNCLYDEREIGVWYHFML